MKLQRPRYYLKRFRSIHPVIRISTGVLLILCGLVGFLPVVGFWMIPLGLLVLSLDFRWAKRGYAWFVVTFRKFKARWRGRRRTPG